MNKSGVTKSQERSKRARWSGFGAFSCRLSNGTLWTPFEHPIVDLGPFWGLFYALLKTELVEVKMASKHVSKMLKWAPEKWYTIADTLSSVVRCLLGALLEKIRSEKADLFYF